MEGKKSPSCGLLDEVTMVLMDSFEAERPLPEYAEDLVNSIFGEIVAEVNGDCEDLPDTE